MHEPVPRPISPQAQLADLADPTFAQAIIVWQKQHGRHTLPWQNTRDAYRIWLSEIMLQQTQVSTVIPYYQRFLTRFPDIITLAQAPSETVMAHWSGLGYYSRARNLHHCAQKIVMDYGGNFPDDPEQLAQLPGIGRSTAAAIAVFTYGICAAILDGNVKRVLTRVFGIEGDPGQTTIERQLWQRAQALLPDKNIGAYTQGLMDLGATICRRSKPTCSVCPLAQRCIALATNRVQLLPSRKTKKVTPEKYTSMLVITDQDRVLLEQRPNHGIWGGLLSLPEIEGWENLAHVSPPALPWHEQIEQAIYPFGTVASYEALETFSHTFTHFKLHIAPYQIKLAHRLDLAGQTLHIWVENSQLEKAPLPAPIKKLLLSVFRQSPA